VCDVFELVKNEYGSENALPPMTERHAYDAFQLARGVRNWAKAKMWIKKAYDASVIGNGADHETTKKYLEFVKNVKAPK